MITEKDKTFYNSYDTNIVVGDLVEFSGGSIIPIVSVTSVYGGTAKYSYSGGGCIIFDPLAVVVVCENKLDVCLIKQKNFTDNLSNLTSLAAEYLS